MGQYTRYKSVIKIIDMTTNIINVLTGVADKENTSPTKWFNVISSNITTTDYEVILESTSLVDSYLTTDNTQTYRIAFVGSFTSTVNPTGVINGDLASITAYVGSNIQITINDSTQDLVLDNSLVPITLIDVADEVQLKVTDVNGNATPSTDSTTVPADAEPSTDVKNKTYGKDLLITVTSRGFVFTISSINTVNQRHKNSMICIQRPVNPSTGIINTAGTCPIFCLYQNYSDRDPTDIDYPISLPIKPSLTDNTPPPNVQFNYKGSKGLYFIVVRETDISNASKNLDTYNVVPPSGSDNNNYTPGTMYSLSFDWTYPITFDDSSYVMKFPFGFMTSRNTYIDEMDLVSFVNAAVFPYEYDISIGVYGESSNRTYLTSFGVDEFGQYVPMENDFLRDSIVGSRVAILSEGGGI